MASGQNVPFDTLWSGRLHNLPRSDFRTDMPHQGISTKLHRENSLMLYGRGNILGVLHFALQTWMKEALFRRSVQDDKKGRSIAIDMQQCYKHKKIQPYPMRQIIS